MQLSFTVTMESLTAILAIFSCLPLFTNASTLPEAGAVYVLANAPNNENFILSSSIDQNGRLTLGQATPTNGIGSFLGGGENDPFASQNPLLVVGDRLYSVNAGSNTISTFSINTHSPSELTLIGQPISSGGEFPISLAVSPRSGQVCVLNAGKVNGVNCYTQDSTYGLLEIPDTNRELHRIITTPPNGAVNVPSQVIFSEDGSALYVTVRGDLNASSTLDRAFIAAWSVDPDTGVLSDNFVKSFIPNGGGDPFGMTRMQGANALVVTDAVSGFDIFDFATSKSNLVANSTNVVVPGQSAICWVRSSHQTGNYYFIDQSPGLLTEVHIDQDFQTNIVRQYPQGLNSIIDELQIATIYEKDYLYLLATGTSSIYALALEGAGNATTIQHLDLSPLAENSTVTDANFWQGIATYAI